ncbi:MAG: PepSY domain-containing protein [Sulfuriflexus sp.]|nr:PepSY domain-containing protein [Sulfuriflexus sp.]
MLQTMYKWHKWIGLIICIPIILWGLSGLLHPTLRLTKPVIGAHKLAPVPLDVKKVAIEPYSIMKLYDIDEVRNIRIIAMKGRQYYQLFLPNKGVRYFDSITSNELVNGEQRYAEYLAQQYLGNERVTIYNTEQITEFNDEYTTINRFLPVWRVNFLKDDALRLYVDTESSRLAASVNDLRAELLWWFGALHNWSYLDKSNLPRITIFLLAMLAMFILGLTGIILYGLRYKSLKQATQRNTAYYHRTVGVLISVSMLMFSFSGGMHVWHKLTQDNRHLRSIDSNFLRTDLSIGLRKALDLVEQKGSVKSVSLVNIDSQPYYRFVHMKGNLASYVHSQRGEILSNADEPYAKQVASEIAGLATTQISSVKPITRFGAEYGFIDRRLPVMQVRFNSEGNPTYYVDLATGKLSAMVNDSKRFEKFTFRMFHKWRFADALSKNGRDAVIAVFILLNVLVVILGIAMYLSKRSR